jgi:hypothetical protein
VLLSKMQGCICLKEAGGVSLIISHSTHLFGHYRKQMNVGGCQWIITDQVVTPVVAAVGDVV